MILDETGFSMEASKPVDVEAPSSVAHQPLGPHWPASSAREGISSLSNQSTVALRLLMFTPGNPFGLGGVVAKGSQTLHLGVAVLAFPNILSPSLGLDTTKG